MNRTVKPEELALEDHDLKAPWSHAPDTLSHAAASPSYDFNWNGPSVVIREQQSVAVFWTKAGDLVIRQERGENEAEDQVITITRANVRVLNNALDNLTLSEIDDH